MSSLEQVKEAIESMAASLHSTSDQLGEFSTKLDAIGDQVTQTVAGSATGIDDELRGLIDASKADVDGTKRALDDVIEIGKTYGARI